MRVSIQASQDEMVPRERGRQAGRLWEIGREGETEGEEGRETERERERVRERVTEREEFLCLCCLGR